MARTALTVINVDRDGVAPGAGQAGTVDGHMFAPTGREVLRLDNASAGPLNVTIPTPVQAGGLDIQDVVIPVPAGGTVYTGGFDSNLFAQRTGVDVGRVYVNYPPGSEASITARLLRHP